MFKSCKLSIIQSKFKHCKEFFLKNHFKRHLYKHIYLSIYKKVITCTSFYVINTPHFKKRSTNLS